MYSSSAHFCVESLGRFSSEVLKMTPNSSKLMSQLVSTCSLSKSALSSVVPAEVLGLMLTGRPWYLASQSQSLWQGVWGTLNGQDQGVPVEKGWLCEMLSTLTRQVQDPRWVHHSGNSQICSRAGAEGV